MRDREGGRILVVAGGVSRRSRWLPTSSRLAPRCSWSFAAPHRRRGGDGARRSGDDRDRPRPRAPAREALSIFSLGLWGGLALGPLLGELVLGETALTQCGCSRPRAASPPVWSASPSRRRRPEARAARSSGRARRPPRGGRAGPRALVRRPRLRRSRDLRRALVRDLGLDGAGSVFLVFSAVVVATRVLARQGARPAGTAADVTSSARRSSRPGCSPSGSGTSRRLAGRRRGVGPCTRVPVADDARVNSGPAAQLVVGTSALQSPGSRRGVDTRCGCLLRGLRRSLVVCAFGPLLGVVLLTRLTGQQAAPGGPSRRRWSGGVGGSGVSVTRIVLGCGNFGGVGSSPAFFGAGDPARRGVLGSWTPPGSSGSRTFDTADAYGGGRSETLDRRVARDKGRRCATRSPSRRRRSTRWKRAHDHGLSRARIRRQLETSLQRLGRRARRPLPRARRSTPTSPQEETLSAFDALVRAGKVGAVGASNFSAEQLAEAVEISELEGLVRYEWVQNSFSLLERGDAETVFPVCREHGLGYEAFGPLAGGWLDGQATGAESVSRGLADDAAAGRLPRVRERRVFDALEALEEDARGRGVSMAGLALAWLLGVPEVTAVVVGPDAGRAPRARFARRSRSSSTPTSTPNCEACSRERPVRARGPRAARHGVVHRGDGRRCSRRSRGASSQCRSASSRGPRAPTRCSGSCPRYRGGGSTPVYALKEIVIVPDEPRARPRHAHGRGAPARRRDGRARSRS